MHDYLLSIVRVLVYGPEWFIWAVDGHTWIIDSGDDCLKLVVDTKSANCGDCLVQPILLIILTLGTTIV
jgi:hypothetical protein